MKKITLQELTLVNFKGQKSLNIRFNEAETQIFGQNKAGKTTIFDAFLWLLFGKDSQDRKDFAVKPLNDKGATTNKTETEVIGVFDFDGNQTTLRRVLVEKWQKRRGTNDLEFTGNETKFFWNDVPFSLSEYNNAIKERIDENLFKLLTNPARFNELAWQERRQILFSIVGIGNDKEIAASISDVKISDLVLKVLNSDKTLKQYKAELSEKKKNIKAELDQIPPRIDESNRSKPTTEHEKHNYEKALFDLRVDFNTIQEQIESESARIDGLNAEHLAKKQALQNDINAREQVIQAKTHELKLEANKALNEHALKVQTAESEIRQLEQEKTSKQNRANEFAKEIERIESVLIALRGKLDTENAKTFSYEPSESSCPTCKQALPSEVVDVDALRANFNTEKLARIEAIQNEGLSHKAKQTEAKESLQVINDAITEASDLIANKVTELETLRKNAPTMGEIDLSEVNKLQAELLEVAKGFELIPVASASTTLGDLKNERINVQSKIDDLSKEYARFEQIEQIENRITELNNRERTLANELSEYENQEFIIDEFNSIKIKSVEQKINSMFTYVTFKMFNTLINGGVEECCEALINGVPYSDANTGSKINAGLDIINVLSRYYGHSAPCFIDNAESVTGFIPFDNQIIKLIVSAEDKSLRIV